MAATVYGKYGYSHIQNFNHAAVCGRLDSLSGVALVVGQYDYSEAADNKKL